MGRFKKCRRVGFIPEEKIFKPAGIPLRELDEIVLTVDEMEAFRLKDMEGLEQSEGAQRMNVSRPTFQRMLYSARSKIAEAIINCKAIKIEGGEYQMGCGCGCHNNNEKEVKTVKKEGQVVIGIPEKDGQVNQHFGRSESFAVISINNGKIEKLERYSTEDLQHNHSGIAQFLKDKGVQVVITGGIGPGAMDGLLAAGFEVVSGTTGDIQETALKFVKGELVSRGVTCSHHGHEHHQH